MSSEENYFADATRLEKKQGNVSDSSAPKKNKKKTTYPNHETTVA